MSANLSLLIITYNRPDDTLALLHSLQKQQDKDRYLGEILLLNNASSVSYREVEQFKDQNPDLPIRYFPHSENLGVAKGRNFLIKKARFPVLFVLDDDVLLPDKKTLKKASEIFTKAYYKERKTAVVTCNIFYYDTGERQRTAFPHKKWKKYKDRDRFLTYYFTGAAHIMKRRLFEKTGYYPEDFFYGMEEYDLSYRIIDGGYTLAFDSSIEIFHKESPKGRVTPKEKLKMMWFNKSVVAWRYLPVMYFYSTVLMWGLQYLKKTGGDWSGMRDNLKKIKEIRRGIKPQKIGAGALHYLKNVKARLWY